MSSSHVAHRLLRKKVQAATSTAHASPSLLRRQRPTSQQFAFPCRVADIHRSEAQKTKRKTFGNLPFSERCQQIQQWQGSARTYSFGGPLLNLRGSKAYRVSINLTSDFEPNMRWYRTSKWLQTYSCHYFCMVLNAAYCTTDSFVYKYWHQMCTKMTPKSNQKTSKTGRN